MEVRPDLTYKYYRKSGSSEVCLVLHGGGMAGIESPFVAQIISTLSDGRRSVFSFNMPYCERGEERTSSPDLTEEVAALASVMEYLRGQGYTKITIVAKSLGAIVASFYLEKQPAADVSVVVLGYVIGSVKTQAIAPNLSLVIQGENDRFGGSSAVRQEIGDSRASIREIARADHSYRDKDSRAVYQAEVIEMLPKSI